MRSILIASLINYGVSEFVWGWRVSWACAGAAPALGTLPAGLQAHLRRPQAQLSLLIENSVLLCGVKSSAYHCMLLRLDGIHVRVRCGHARWLQH